MKFANSSSLSPGYFGKLPHHSDFVKYNAGSLEILTLDKWIQEGLISAKLKLKNNWKNYYKNSLPYKFFYPFSGTDNNTSGIIFPSSDKSGREFPFLMFINFDEDFIRQIPIYLIPFILDKPLNFLNQLYMETNFTGSLNDLNNRMNQIDLPRRIPTKESANNEYLNYISNTSQKEFWQRTFGSFNDQKKLAVIKNIFDLKLISNSSSFGLRISFMSDNINYVFDLCFLINLILRDSGVSSLLPAMFWASDENYNICLYIFPVKPTSLNYLDLIYPEDDNGRILKIEELNDNKRELDIYFSYKKFLDKDEMALVELLKVI